MLYVHIGLEWWPPDPDNPVGEERAQELAQRFRVVAGRIVDEAEVDLRQRITTGAEVVRSGAPARYIARFRFDDPMACYGGVGTEALSTAGYRSGFTIAAHALL